MGARKYQIYLECWTWYLKSERSQRVYDINNLVCEIISFISAQNLYKALYFI
jgi:hypothetical protein